MSIAKGVLLSCVMLVSTATVECSGCFRHVVNDWLGPIGGPAYVEIVQEPTVASGTCVPPVEPATSCVPDPCVASGTLQLKNVSGATIWYEVGDSGVWRPLAPGATTKALTISSQPLLCGSSAPADEITIGFSLSLTNPSWSFGYSASCTTCGSPH